MKTKLLLLAALAFTTASSFGQTVVARKTLPLYEGFNYEAGTKLFNEGQIGGQGGWQIFNVDAVAQTASNPVIVTTPVWNMGGLPAATAQALNFWGGSDDPVLHFTDQGNGAFTIYSSFIFRITSAGSESWTDTAGEYFYSFGKTSSSNAVNYCSNVYIKRIGAAGTTFNIGIAENNSGTVQYSTTAFDFDTDIRIVIKYETDGLTGSGSVSSLWINPTVSNTEPATTLNTLTSDVTTSARTNLDKVRINKSSTAKTPLITLDEIRVANTWDKVTGPNATLSVAKNDIEGLKVYPNPVKEGKLFISSASSAVKTVAIYNVLGAQVLKKEVTSGLVDVSSLNKGVYVLKITEAGKTSTRKVVID